MMSSVNSELGQVTCSQMHLANRDVLEFGTQSGFNGNGVKWLRTDILPQRSSF